MRTMYLVLAAICAVFAALFGLAIVFGETKSAMFVGFSLSLTVAAAAWALFQSSRTHEFDGEDPPTHLLTF